MNQRVFHFLCVRCTVYCIHPTLRSTSLIHFMTRWEVHTNGSTFWCSDCIRRACSTWKPFEPNTLYPDDGFCLHLPRKHKNIHCWRRFSHTSFSKWSKCSSSMPSSRLTWWNLLVMLRWHSRSWRVRELSMRPSTRWVWKAWEYWGKPTSLNQALATQWWSISAALDSLQKHRMATN